MLHPALAQALVTAHLEDLQRAAARRHAIRLVWTGARVTGFTRDCVRALGLAPDHHDLGALAGELDRCCASFPRVAPVVRTSVTAATLLSADHHPLAHSHQSGQQNWSDDHRDEPLLERGILSDMPITLHRTAEITVGLPRLFKEAAGETLRAQTSFDQNLSHRANDSSYTFRQHLQQIDGAIEE